MICLPLNRSTAFIGSKITNEYFIAESRGLRCYCTPLVRIVRADDHVANPAALEQRKVEISKLFSARPQPLY